MSSECCRAVASVLLAATCHAPAVTREPAERLVRGLDRRGMEAIAARDPSAPNRIVAARPFGPTQMTVLAGTVAEPQLDAWLAAGRFSDVYHWLLARAVPRDGFVLHDLNGLGLRADREDGQAFDMFAPGDAPQVSFDGDWAMQGLSQDDYCAAFTRAEQAYDSALHLLLAALTTRQDSRFSSNPGPAHGAAPNTLQSHPLRPVR